MPKMKTSRSAAKRFSVTGTGKYKRSKGNKQHILGKKSPKRKRHLRGTVVVSPASKKQLDKMLPYL